MEFSPPGGLERKEIGRGDFVTAYSFLSGAEGELGREMVVKEYDPSKLENLTGCASLAEALAKLRHRREFTARYYAELPNLVLGGELFIGETAGGSQTIFDVQPMADGPAVVSSEGEATIGRLGPEERATFENEARIFLRRSLALAEGAATLDPQDAEFQGTMFDLGDENLRVTESGHLQVIDTNVYLPLWEEGGTLYNFEGQAKYLMAAAGVSIDSVISEGPRSVR